MYRSVHRWALLWFVPLCIIGSCSKDQEQPNPGAAAPTQRSSSSRRVYTALPAELLAAAPVPVSAASPALAVAEASAAGNFEKASAALETQLSKPGSDRRITAVAGLHAIRACMQAKEPDSVRAASLVPKLEPLVKDPGMPASVKQEWRWWSVLSLLTAGKESLKAGASVAALADGLREHTSQLTGSSPYSVFIARAADVLAASAGSEAKASVDPVEQALIDLQLDLPGTNLVVPLQRSRVNMLLKSGRHEEALHECRVLLALAAAEGSSFPDALALTDSVLEAAGKQEARDALMQRVCESQAAAAEGAANWRAAARAVPRLQERLTGLQQAKTVQQGPDSASIKLGYAYLLAGQADAAAKQFAAIAACPEVLSYDEMQAVLTGVAAAECLANDQYLRCDEPALRIWQPASGQPSAARWRDAAKRYLDTRAGLPAAWVADQRPELGLALACVIANDARRGMHQVAVFKAAMAALKASPASQPASAGMTPQQFGLRLSAPSAVCGWTRLVSQERYSAGDFAGAMAEIETAAGRVPSVKSDPEICLLAAACFVRAGKPNEALASVQPLPSRADASLDVVARANLMVAAIHLQQGSPIQARQALAIVLDEVPGTPHAERAAAMLEKL